MLSFVNEKKLDIAIIGGGSAGLGVALALKKANKKVAIFEKGSLGRETTDNSLRIIHGGFRYLQNLDFKRMFQSIKDQHFLSQNYPSYIQQLPCFLALQPYTSKSKLPLTLAQFLYSICYALVSGKFSLKGSVVKKDEVTAICNLLTDNYINGGFSWNDYLLINPKGFIATIKQEIQNSGISIFENSKLLKANRLGDTWQLEFEQNTIHADLVINATGPWLTEVANIFEEDLTKYDLAWARVFNLVVNKNLLAKSSGIAFEGNNNALFFMTKRDQDKIALGTFELAPTRNSEKIKVASKEVPLSQEELVQAVAKLNQACSNLNLTLNDIVDIDFGKLACFNSKLPEVKLIPKEKIILGDRILHVLSTKYTTFVSHGLKVAELIK
jgi:glycerol-3-phosphate dehydrogenase